MCTCEIKVENRKNRTYGIEDGVHEIVHHGLEKGSFTVDEARGWISHHMCGSCKHLMFIAMELRNAEVGEPLKRDTEDEYAEYRLDAAVRNVAAKILKEQIDEADGLEDRLQEKIVEINTSTVDLYGMNNRRLSVLRNVSVLMDQGVEVRES
jgi:hypothetical protein